MLRLFRIVETFAVCSDFIMTVKFLGLQKGEGAGEGLLPRFCDYYY